MPRIKKRAENQKYWKESIHTRLSYYLGILAFGIQFVIGLRYFNERFGQLCIFESMFALTGVLFLDLLHGKPMIPKKYRSIESNLLVRTLIIFGVIALIQFIFQIIPLTIRDVETALAIVFCGVSEELFFRGLVLEPFFRFGRNQPDLKLWNDKAISYIEIIAILISGTIFAIFHINYYGNASLMLMVLVGGFWLGFMYWYWKDLTACILAHFLLNIIFVAQYYQVIF